MVEELRKIVTFLDGNDFGAIRRFPLRKYPCTGASLFVNEANVFVKSIFKRNNIFSISLIPSIYPEIFGNKGLNLLRDCFFLNKPLSLSTWRRLFPDGRTDRWKEMGLLKKKNDEWYFTYRIVPFGKRYFVTSRFDRSEPHFTFLSYDSLYFSSFLSERLRKLSFTAPSALDLGCGVGIQAITVSPFCERVTGIDLNESGVELSNLNAFLHGVENCDFRVGDMNEAGGQFDLIVSNPPFIYSTKTEGQTADSSGGEPFGLGATMDLVRRAPDLLKEKGRMFLVTRSPLFDQGDYLLNSLSGLLGRGFGWIYRHISDSVVPLEPFEKVKAILGYRQVILEIFRGDQRRLIGRSRWHRATSLF